MNTTYEPIGNTVLLETILPSTTIAIPGGFELSEGGQYKVVEVGYRVREGIFSVGDIVIVASSMGMTKIKDTNYYLTPSDNIIARIKE
jgi:co-chaperonin GroES (HSP10)